MEKQIYTEETDEVKLDSKDKKILKILVENARTPLSVIARKTGIPKDSVLYRVRRLEKLNAVQYVTIINPLRMGYHLFKFVNLILHNFTPDREKKLLSYLLTDPLIIYVAQTSGRYDYTVGIVAKNTKHFGDIMKNLRTKFSDIIKDFESVDILGEYKYDYIVDLIKETK